MERLELSHGVGSSGNGTCTVENSVAVSSPFHSHVYTEEKDSTCPRKTLDMQPNNVAYARHAIPQLHWYTHSWQLTSPKLEVTKMSTNRCMDKRCDITTP